MARFYEPRFVVLKSVHVVCRTEDADDAEEGERFVPVSVRLEGEYLVAGRETESYAVSFDCGEWLLPRTLDEATVIEAVREYAGSIANNAASDGLEIAEGEISNEECAITYEER